MENFKKLFDQMLGWVTNDMAKGLFIDTYNKIEREKNKTKRTKLQLQQADVSSLLIAWEQFRKANWWESTDIDVEKVLIERFSAIYTC